MYAQPAAASTAVAGSVRSGARRCSTKAPRRREALSSAGVVHRRRKPPARGRSQTGDDMQRNGLLYFIVGGLVVAVAVLGYVIYDQQTTDEVEMKIELPGGTAVGLTGPVGIGDAHI